LLTIFSFILALPPTFFSIILQNFLKNKQISWNICLQNNNICGILYLGGNLMRKKTYDKSQVVLKFIQDYIAENGFAPSVREVCNNCGIKSTATAFQYMNRLSEQGQINKVGLKKRAISVKQQTVNVPLIGTVAAGQPIFATENYEDNYSIPSNFFSGEDLFMLTVHGSSMIKIGMLDGDKIIVKKQQSAENGEIVVALVDDSATVKRFYKRDGKIILHPENDEMEDFVFDDVTILGKVVGLMRNKI
jgi:repressor LexA